MLRFEQLCFNINKFINFDKVAVCKRVSKNFLTPVTRNMTSGHRISSHICFIPIFASSHLMVEVSSVTV